MNAISAGHEVTLSVAEEILRSGGNAFDAAIAAYAAAWVAEPCMASAGGGAFANVYTKEKASYVFDFFCQTPKQKDLTQTLNFIPIPVDFGEITEMYYGGFAAMAIPGSVAGIFSLHKELGSIPMRELLQPAIQLSKDGVAVNNFQHLDLSLLHSVFDHQERARQLFKPDGSLVPIGTTIKLPFLADFLDYLGHEGPNAFYKGEVANKIIQASNSSGGFLSEADFSSYQTIIRKPLVSQFADHKILANPLPSTGGALMAIGLDYLNSIPRALDGADFLAAFRKMDSFEKDPEKLGNFLAQRNRRGATSHLNVLDRWGNAISLTMTLGEGSGYFVPGTDIHMNNMLGESSLVPNGWHSWKEDVRLSSMMNPTLAIDANGKPKLIIGSGGASRIPGAIMQVIVNILRNDQDLIEAIDNPRMHYENNALNMEPNFPFKKENIPNQLNYKYWEKQSMFFGGTHAITWDQNKIKAHGDQRRDGVALIFD